MKNLALIIALSCTLFAFAEENKVILQSLDPNEDLSDFSDKDFKKVHGVQSPPSKSSLPSVAIRDSKFKAAGLEIEVKGMDELDRDLLYAHSEQHSIAELVKRYPKLPRNKLEKLKASIPAGTP